MTSLQNINNFDTIQQLLDFPDSDSFYYIMIFRTIADGNPSHRVINTYKIFSIEDFLSYKDEIINICNSCNARAYFFVNVKSYKETILKRIKSLVDLISNNSGYLSNSYDYITVNKFNYDSSKIRYVLCIKNPELLDTYIQILNEVCKKTISYIPIAKGTGIDIIIPEIPITYFYQMCRIREVEWPIILQDYRVLLYMKNDISS